MTNPWSTAVERLRDGLADFGLTVDAGVLGVRSVDHDPNAATHRIFLTPEAVLVLGAGQVCGRCLGARWQRLRPAEVRDALEVHGGFLPCGAGPAVTPFLVDCLRAVLARCSPAAADPDELAGWAEVTRVDLQTLEVVTTKVLATAGCCASPDSAEANDVAELRKSAPTRYHLRRLEDFSLPSQALVNPVCGMLGKSAYPDLTWPTTAPVSGFAHMRGPRGLSEIAWSGQRYRIADSRTLALLEGVERYAGAHCRRRERVVRASFNELTPAALDPRDCGAYPTLAEHGDAGLIAFSPDTPIDWVPGRSIATDERVWVPLRSAHYNDGSDEDNFVHESSSGCASGSCVEEALLFALLELVERDAFLLAWYGGVELAEIDTRSVHDPGVAQMIDRAELEGFTIRLFDNRIDLDIPVVAGVAERRDGDLGALTFSAGASLDLDTAAAAAVAELVTHIPARRRQVMASADAVNYMIRDYRAVRALADHALLFGHPAMAPLARRYRASGASRPIEQLPLTRYEPGTDLRMDLEYVIEQIRSIGFDIIVVDQTAPEQQLFGLHTVRAIVPGLVPIDFGWAKQRVLQMSRLYTAFERSERFQGSVPINVHRVPHPFP